MAKGQVQHTIRFLRKGRIVEWSEPNPMRTVLDYLRLTEGSTGTKEGCNEGDCGACTVAIGKLQEGRLVYEPANACILLMGQLQGRELVTVDDLAKGETLHPVQQAMVETHASQCGFCTPGFVMSLFTLHHAGEAPTRQQIVDHLAGNLCRCTGYRPIIDAAMASCTGAAADDWAKAAPETEKLLASINDGRDVIVPAGDGFIAIPATAESLAAAAAVHTDATIVAGATDVGLWITKQMRVLPKVIHLHAVAELHAIRETADAVTIGAAATYAEAAAALSRLDVDVGNVLARIGSAQVRTSGTIGGNIANGSPIGDMPPMLIALGATLHLRQASQKRSMPLEQFFIAYGKQDRNPGELVWQIDVPRLKAGETFRAYKLSKRFDQDISAVMAGFKFVLDGPRIVSARLAFGGMAATPKRATLSEVALAGAYLADEASWQKALAALAKDFQPLTDMRASADYRIEAARGLLLKALLELTGDASSLLRVSRTREEVV